MRQGTSNETIRLLLERGSCRNFEDRPIPPHVLDTILEAGVHAPTGGNLQPYSIIVVEDKEVSKKLAELTFGQRWVEDAPVNLIFCIDLHRNERWAKLEVAPYSANASFRHFWISFQDTIIAAQNICTAADALGCGSVYIGSILECFADLRQMFELPDGVFPVVLLSLGYPKTPPKVAPKLGVDVVAHKGKYRQMQDRELLDAFNTKYGGRKREISDEALRVLEDACRNCHGDEFAKKCIARVREQGHISVPQVYFGLHYKADEMAKHNDVFLQTMEDFGFTCFKKWVPYAERQ